MARLIALAPAVLIAGALSLLPGMAEAQSVPPGTTPVNKMRIKGNGKNAILFEYSDFSCPARINTAAGRRKEEATLRRELKSGICSGREMRAFFRKGGREPSDGHIAKEGSSSPGS